MFGKDDFKVESLDDILEMLPMAPFLGLVAPLIFIGFTLGFFMNLAGAIREE